MRKLSQYIVKEILFSIAIGAAITTGLAFIELFFGTPINLNLEGLKRLFFSFLMAFILTFLNSIYLNLVNHQIKWHPSKDYLRILAGFIGSIPISLFGIWLVHLIVNVGFENYTFQQFLEKQKTISYFGSLVITFVVSLIFHVFFLYNKLQENKFNEQKIIAGNANAQFESLKNQIDPHFLFNSLNVLSSLIEENTENAQRFTTSLSKIYRYVLEQKDKELVPLKEELDFAKTYMKLLTMRFENSLTYTLPESFIDENAKVVPLSLQLLLENTVKHNIVSDQQPLHISIMLEGDYIVVSNNLQTKEVLGSGKGVGLKNIINRYAIITERQVKIEKNDLTFNAKIPILTKEVSLIKNKFYNEDDAYQKAKKQVKEIKNFYINLITYCIVIPLLIYINYKSSWDFKWVVFPILGWGLGLALQAFSAFGQGRNWEERKINEIMEKNQIIKNRKWQ